MVIPPYITTIMTTRRTQVGSRKWSIRIRPTLNVGLLVMLVLWSSVLACSKVKDEGDPKSLSFNHYCPDVPAGVTCPGGSTDNTSTSSGAVNKFEYNVSDWGASRMYWGEYRASKDYWYIDPDGKIQKGCMPETLSYDNGTTFPHYSTAHYWSGNDGNLGRNSEPPYARCYKAWMTDNATDCSWNSCQTANSGAGKLQFKRTMMVGQTMKEGTSCSFCGPYEKWGPGHQADNDSLIGTSFACASYPDGQCSRAFSSTALMDNHTGKVLDNGTFDGAIFPLGAVKFSLTHVCTLDNGSSCAYVD